MNIVGLDKAAVLAALYNRARPVGLGFLEYKPAQMTVREARQLLDSGQTYFDSLNGRGMKIDLSGELWGDDEVGVLSYNGYNGDNAAEKAIAELVATGDVNPVTTQEAHRVRTLGSAGVVKASLGQEGSTNIDGNVTEIRFGYLEIVEYLGPAVDRALEELKEDKER